VERFTETEQPGESFLSSPPGLLVIPFFDLDKSAHLWELSPVLIVYFKESPGRDPTGARVGGIGLWDDDERALSEKDPPLWR
jgi:hypothetical protein